MFLGWRQFLWCNLLGGFWIPQWSPARFHPELKERQMQVQLPPPFRGRGVGVASKSAKGDPKRFPRCGLQTKVRRAILPSGFPFIGEDKGGGGGSFKGSTKCWRGEGIPPCFVYRWGRLINCFNGPPARGVHPVPRLAPLISRAQHTAVFIGSRF